MESLKTHYDLMIYCYIKLHEKLGKCDEYNLDCVNNEIIRLVRKNIDIIDISKTIKSLECLKMLYKEEHFLAILFVLDEILVPLLSKDSIKENMIFYNSLNSFEADKYKLYPKQKNIITSIIDELDESDYKLREKVSSCAINGFLCNFLVLEEIDYKVTYRIKAFPLLKKRILERKKIDIVVNSFSNKNIMGYFDCDTTGGKFSIIKAKEDLDDELYNRFYESLKKSLDQKPDLVIFPEMYLSTRILNDIESNIKNLKIYKSTLILIGTLSQDSTNTAYLYDNYGNRLLVQKKYGQYKFKPDKKVNYTLVENRTWDNQNDILISALDLTGIGRLSIAICKDMKSKYKTDALINFDANILLIPSYSPSNDITSNFTYFSKEYHMSMIFCNALAPFVNQENNELKRDNPTLGMVVLPGKVGSIRSATITYFEHNDDKDHMNHVFSKGIFKTIPIE